MYRSLILYGMDVYGTPSPHFARQHIDQNAVRHKYSHGPNAVSSMQFRVGAERRTGTTTGTGTAVPPSDLSHATFPRTKDSDISLAEKVTPRGDEEAQLHEAPSMLAPGNL
jgi:hypothetical protein